MANTLNRDDYRRIKNYSKTEMEKWLDYHQSMVYNILRKDLKVITKMKLIVLFPIFL